MSLGYMLFPSVAKERDRLKAEQYTLHDQHAKLLEEFEYWTAEAKKYQSMWTEEQQKRMQTEEKLAAKMLECMRLEREAKTLATPPPIEKKAIRAATAADVRRITAEEWRKDQIEEFPDGVR